VANVTQFKELFGSPLGKKVLWKMCKDVGFLESNHCPGDPYSSAFNEGRRTVVVDILRKTNMNLDKINNLVEEGEKDNADWLDE